MTVSQAFAASLFNPKPQAPAVSGRQSRVKTAVASGSGLNETALKFGETICFITRSVSEETQERRVYLAHASGYEERMHA
jgi:hypothetical protein